MLKPGPGTRFLLQITSFIDLSLVLFLFVVRPACWTNRRVNKKSRPIIQTLITTTDRKTAIISGVQEGMLGVPNSIEKIVYRPKWEKYQKKKTVFRTFDRAYSTSGEVNRITRHVPSFD